MNVRGGRVSMSGGEISMSKVRMSMSEGNRETGLNEKNLTWTFRISGRYNLASK